MKQKIFSLMMAVAFTLSLVSCTDESDLDLLSSGNWKLSYLEAGGNHLTAAQAQTDFSISFKSGGEWVAAVSIEGSSLETPSGSYSLSARVLTIKKDGETEIWNIRTLTKTELIVDFDDYGVPTTWGFKH